MSRSTGAFIGKAKSVWQLRFVVKAMKCSENDYLARVIVCGNTDIRKKKVKYL
jgi:hypothetical protein